MAEMLYTEGVANYGVPESCVHHSNVVREAFDRGVCRRGIEPRKLGFRVPTLLPCAEGNIVDIDMARRRRTLRGQRPTACTRLISAREPGGPESSRCSWSNGTLREVQGRVPT
jgi:hypothetical protein